MFVIVIATAAAAPANKPVCDAVIQWQDIWGQSKNPDQKYRGFCSDPKLLLIDCLGGTGHADFPQKCRQFAAFTGTDAVQAVVGGT